MIAVEKTTAQLAVIQQLRQAGLPLKEIPPRGDKVARSLPAAVGYENGLMFHPRQASWLHDFEEELINFPAGPHDDQVDALAYATTAFKNQDWEMAYGVVHCSLCNHGYVGRPPGRPCPKCGGPPKPTDYPDPAHL